MFSVACAGPAIGWNGIEPDDPEPASDPELRAYKEAHFGALGTRFVATESEQRVLDAARDTGLLYLGDHHRDAALHARHLALLEGLVARGAHPVLALEAIGTEDDARVARFVAGDGTLDELAARIRTRWPESWLDSPEVDAAHYRALLAFARRTGTTVVGLEPTPRVPLAARDAAMAATIRAAVAARTPDQVVVVVVGHTHLLGADHVVDRVDVPAVVVGARLSTRLRDAKAPPGEGAFRRTDAGVRFPPEAF